MCLYVGVCLYVANPGVCHIMEHTLVQVRLQIVFVFLYCVYQEIKKH